MLLANEISIRPWAVAGRRFRIANPPSTIACLPARSRRARRHGDHWCAGRLKGSARFRAVEPALAFLVPDRLRLARDRPSTRTPQRLAMR